MAGDILTVASDLMVALSPPSFFTATATGRLPSFVFKAGVVGKPGPAGNGFTPACTIC